MISPDPILARLAALKTTPTYDLKTQWRELFGSEPPPCPPSAPMEQFRVIA